MRARSGMAPAIVYDMLRLFLGAGSATPRGIDRVDLGYARHLFEHWRGDCQGLLPTPWGLRLYERTRVLRSLDRLESLWRERRAADDDPVLAGVLARLDGAGPDRGHARAGAVPCWRPARGITAC